MSAHEEKCGDPTCSTCWPQPERAACAECGGYSSTAPTCDGGCIRPERVAEAPRLFCNHPRDECECDDCRRYRAAEPPGFDADDLREIAERIRNQARQVIAGYDDPGAVLNDVAEILNLIADDTDALAERLPALVAERNEAQREALRWRRHKEQAWRALNTVTSPVAGMYVLELIQEIDALRAECERLKDQCKTFGDVLAELPVPPKQMVATLAAQAEDTARLGRILRAAIDAARRNQKENPNAR